MFAQKIARGSLALALVLTASNAFAEAPARGGYRNSIVTATCTPASTTSYRDAAKRLGAGSVESASTKPTNGYRDAYARVPAEMRSAQIADAARACRM